MITLIAVSIISTEAQAGTKLEDAFWQRDWQTMDDIYVNAVSRDIESSSAALSPREKSIYVNGLWLQGRYEDGVLILESIQQDFPNGLRAYADMLFILGKERTNMKEEAFAKGKAVWDAAPPENLKYYLAYAMARLSRDLEYREESLVWYRRMYELAPDKKRAAQALSQIMELGAASTEEAAAMLINSPANAKALALLASVDTARASGLAAYALGYEAYTSKNYKEAIKRFDIASRDVEYGEAARYYEAYSAYREKRDDIAYKLWSDIALTGFDYPQRSVQRLESLAGRAKKDDILKLFKKLAEARQKDYPDVAADALAASIRIGDSSAAKDAERLLFTMYASSVQAATIRWERGWKAWKDKKYRDAYDQWLAGYSHDIKNSELASRMLYWQARALEKLNSPAAADRIKKQLVTNWPGEYYTFLVSADGGIVREPVPEKFVTPSDLVDWGFVTYARLEGLNITAANVTSADVPTLYRAVRLALWDEDYSSAVRAFSVMQRAISPNALASSELLKMSYPRAFEKSVRAATEKTGTASEIIWGVMRQESLYEPDVTSSAGAYGLMQLMPATAKGEAKRMAISDDAYLRPADNIMLGANHLVGLFARFKEAPLALAAYNAGGSPVSRWSKDPITDMAEWVEDIGYRETRGYVKAVLRNIEVYKALYPKEGNE
jgi:soluble lytic murein transglycosylase